MSLAAFSNISATSTRGKCARTHLPYALDNGARAAVNADLYNRPEGTDKQVRIAHMSQTVNEQSAAEMWQIIQGLYDFEAYRENGYSDLLGLVSALQENWIAENRPPAEDDTEDTEDAETADQVEGAEVA